MNCLINDDTACDEDCKHLKESKKLLAGLNMKKVKMKDVLGIF